MPRREDIEKFAQVLNSLGDEPAIRAARSEAIEEVPAAEAAASSTSAEGELDTLDLGPEAGAEPGAADTSGGAGGPESESLQDIFATLGDLSQEGAEGSTGQGPAESFELPQEGAAAAEAGGGAAEEGLDFASLFGEESTPSPIEDLDQPAPPARGGAARPAAARTPQPAPPAAGGEEEPFSFPGGEPESLQADLSQMESLPDEGAGLEGAGLEGAGLEAPESEGSGEGISIEGLDLEGLDLTGGPEGGGEPEPATEAGAGVEAGLGTEESAELGGLPPGESAGGEAFEDLGSLSFPSDSGTEEAPTEPSPEATFEEPGEEAGLGAASAFEEPAAEALQGPEAEPAEGFDLPSLDDLSFSEPGAEPSAAAEPAQETSFEEQGSGEAGAMPSEEAGPSFDLESTSFDEPGAATGEETGLEAGPDEGGPFGVEPPGGAGEAPGAGLEGLPGGEEGLDDLNLDQFSLPESAGQFGVPGEGGGEPFAMPGLEQERAAEVPPPPRARRAERRPPPQPRPSGAAPAGPELVGATGQIELTAAQFAQLKQTLESLPRNLKIAVQDLVGEGAVSGPDLSALLGLLVRGASAQEIATLAGRITGKRIRIPPGYQKKSGMALEAEQRTFAYAFRENFLPLVRTVAITVLAGAIFGFLGYNYIYRPLFAISNYRAGYAQIANDRFSVANERFNRATSVWPLKQWYYRYAEGFADRRAYQLAEQKYEDLLKAWPGDKKGTLDYADLESTRLADYAKADGLLKRYLDAHMYDYEALLASGDNYLAWADRDHAKYEPARLAYATLLEHYGVKDELLFRMLRYFIRTDNAEEVERLRAFYATRPEVKVDPDAYAELGGYLIDHRRLEFAQDVLLRADGVRHGILAVHYNLARYFRLVQDPEDEKKALDATKRILDLTRNHEPLTVRRLGVEIDTHTRLGEYYYRRQQLLPAQAELQEAVRLVESNQRMGLIDKGPLYGRPYAVLGDLSYYVEGNLQEAAERFQSAADNGFTSTLLTYKMGYVQYAQGDYKAALASFAAAEDASAYPSSVDLLGPDALPAGQQIPSPAPRGAASAPGSAAAAPSPESAAPAAAQPVNAPTLNPVGQPPQNLLYALGNAFYKRGDYFAAQASYLRLRDRLESRRAALGTLHPEDRPDDRAFLDTLVKVDNNLGVTMYRLGQKTADRSKRSEALVYLSAANEIASSLSRSPDTVQRSEDRAVPSLNMRGILYPVSGFVLQLYSDLPKDFQAVDW